MQHKWSSIGSTNKEFVKIYQEEGGAEGQAKHHWARQVGLVHDAAVRHLHGVENRQGLLPDVVEVDPQLWDKETQQDSGGNHHSLNHFLHIFSTLRSSF